jgi:ElaA protein
MNVKVKSFDELSVHELYAILKLRQEVFIIEQNSIYDELDGKDQESKHVMGFLDDTLIAYSRILPPGLSYSEASIGRIITAPSVRRKNLGRKLVRFSLDTCHSLYPDSAVRISAQQHLQKFYSEFGFKTVSEPYDDGGILHVQMLLSA